MRVFREFIGNFRRFRTAGMLNLLGLTVASAVLMGVVFQIHFENGYDRFRRDSDRIFRVEMRENEHNFSANVPYPMYEMLADGCPAIEQSFVQRDGLIQAVAVEDEKGGINKFNILVATASPSMCDVIDFEMLCGDARKALEEPGMILLPESQANLLFGSVTAALNRQMRATGGNWNTIDGEYAVAGVYRDFPKNSVFTNSCYAKLNERELNWWNSNVQLFIKSNVKDPVALAKQLNELKLGEEVNPNAKCEKRVLPLTDIYFDVIGTYDTKAKGNEATSRVLCGVAALILLIAAINFINFSMSLAPARIKGVNTHKVLGASTGVLRFQMMGEAVIYALVAFVLSLFLLEVLNSTFVAELFVTSISPSAHLSTALWCGGIILAVGMLAGIFPARYITSFAPALVLKGSFALSPRGQRVRNGLMCFQFVTSVVLIICMLLMNGQRNYLQNYSLGFDKEQVVYFTMNEQLFQQKNAFVDELLQSPDVVNYACTEWLPNSNEAATISGKWNEDEFQLDRWFVDGRFLELMGIPVTRGDEFSENVKEYQVIFTETTMKEMPFLEKYMGKDVQTAGVGGGAQFVGVAKDIHHLSLHHGFAPVEFVYLPNYSFRYMVLKVSSNTGAAMEHITNVFNRFSKYTSPDIHFLDDAMALRYEKDTQLARAISLFGLIAILISLAGVYGMVVYNAQYKRKEIAVRKVNGATETEILVLLNRNFFRLLIGAFILSCPLAYYLISLWLSDFAYKTPIYWWMFLLAGVAVFLISLLTVSWQSWRAATCNPVEALKSE